MSAGRAKPRAPHGRRCEESAAGDERSNLYSGGGEVRAVAGWGNGGKGKGWGVGETRRRQVEETEERRAAVFEERASIQRRI